MATASEARQSFRHWRRRRPFWGGLLLLLAGLELFFSANLTLGDMEVHVGPQGFLSYLLPLILLLCGLLVWFTPAQRLFYGILGLLTGLYSLLGLNLGGFFIGMVLGIVGGALTIAWAPVRLRPAESVIGAAPSSPLEEPPAGDAPTEFLPGFAEPDDAEPTDSHPTDSQPANAHPADAHPADAHPADPDLQPVDSQAVEEEAPPAAPPGGGVHRKALVITLVPLAVTAAVLFGGGHTAARADACPDGVPSRSIAATPSSKSATKSSEGLAKKAATPKKTATSSAPKKSTPTPTPSASASAGDDDEESDHPILDGIKDGVSDIVDGVGKLLGVGDDDPTATPSPSASPSSSAPAPSATPAPSGSQPAPSGSAPASPAPGGSGTPSGSASPSPTPTPADVPCLGPRVLGKVAGADDVPAVSVDGGLLEGDSLTMYDSTYDGVSTLTTREGTLKALKFSMRKAVTKPFTLTIPEANGAHTVIKSNELTIDGNVRFYTPKFQGKLFGLIPVTFTPEQPPPLTLPVLWFTDVKIQLAFVRCDTLTGHPLNITEPA